MNTKLKRQYIQLGGRSDSIVTNLKLIENYDKYLDTFKEKALLKFIKGRIEHADQNPNNLDIEKEIENELFDITAYNFLKLCN